VLLSYFSYDRKPVTAQDGNGKKCGAKRKLITSLWRIPHFRFAETFVIGLRQALSGFACGTPA
jgi:hypothetical protein